MTTLSKARLNQTRRVLIAHPLDWTARRFRPRRSIVVAVSLMLAALTVPLLMAIDWLPANFTLGFVGWALAAFGGYRLLTQCGEI